MTGGLRRTTTGAAGAAAASWLAAAAGWLAAVLLLAVAVACDRRVAALGRADLASDPAEAVVYGSAIVSAATVGLVVAIRRRRHLVGWLFLALGIALGVGAAGDAWALLHAAARGETGPTPRLALVAGQASFIAWFALLAAILHLTPTGTPLTRRWRLALWTTALAAVASLAAKAVQDTAFEPPFEGLTNPWALRSISSLVNAVAGIGITVVMAGLVAAAASLVVRYRRAAGDERLQLRWLFGAVVPLPLLVVASFAAAATDQPALRTFATGGFVLVVPVVAGLSVMRFRLYDVDRILSRATAYVCSSVVLAVLFVVVSVVVGQVFGLVADGSTVPAVVGAVVAATTARPLYERLQDRIDRRFDRRRHDALTVLRSRLGSATSGTDLTDAFAVALGDPSATLAYWIDDELGWVSAAGRAASLRPGDIEVTRDTKPVARLRIGAGTDARLATTLLNEASTELDNVRLRAVVAVQLEEVRASRARIVAAQADERHRIERNLHDGAQQRLLGLALELRALQVGDNPLGSATIDRTVSELGAAVRELRELANGLRPSALADGLANALDELAGRGPVPITLTIELVQLSPLVEETLWFVACEAMANVTKHAGASRGGIELNTSGTTVTLVCWDDGRGHATLSGRGLQGISDRVEAVGGQLNLTSPAGACATATRQAGRPKQVRSTSSTTGRSFTYARWRRCGHDCGPIRASTVISSRPTAARRPATPSRRTDRSTPRTRA